MLKNSIPVLLALLLSLVACNKDEEGAKAINIEIWGYNVGNTQLEVSIDTTIYRSIVTQPNSVITFNKIYTYLPGNQEAQVKITDKATGKAVFQQTATLGGSELELFYPYVYINGTVLDTKPPVADTATNKLGFYIHYPQSEEALDIFLRNETGQMVSIAKNAKPGTWVMANYLPQEGFKEKKEYVLCFTKAGTTDNWYFGGNETKSKVGDNSLVLPKGEEKGLVRTYFVTPSALQLEVIRLFKRPKSL